jgi:sugar lactone lactonase YvrE
MHRRLTIRAAVVAAAVSLLTIALAAPAAAHRPAVGGLFPTTIALPDGFPPEGIAIGPGPFAYFGSRVDGSIYRANLITGEGRIIVGPGSPAVPALGLKTDHRGRLFVAGGPSGTARVIDLRTRTEVARYQLASGPTSFVNDVVLTPHAAWFTDSLNQVLYKLPLGPGGRLPAQADVVALPLTGDISFEPGFNANGIERTPDGRALIIVQTNTGKLFRVDPTTGDTKLIDLGAESVPGGDGLLLRGRTLYVVQNTFNTVAVIRLDAAGRSGTVVDRLTDSRFDIPTTVAAFANRLYLPNSRFTTPVTPTTQYTAVAIPRHR